MIKISIANIKAALNAFYTLQDRLGRDHPETINQWKRYAALKANWIKQQDT